MNKLFATVAIVAGLVAANTSANAGFLGDVAHAVGNRVRENHAPQTRPTQTASAYSWMSNKGYMDCLHTMPMFAHNDAEARKGVDICSKRYGSR